MPNKEFGPDGTQAPPPPRLYPDPLAGLVTADTWVAPQWKAASFTSRVAVPTPPQPTEEIRQAIWNQMENEQRRPRGRYRRQTPPQWGQESWAPAPHAPLAPHAQMPAPQQQQPAAQTSGVAGLVGCLVVFGFLVLVVMSVVASILNG